MWRFPLNILIKFKKLNLEPTDKWPVLKFEKSIYFKTKTGIGGKPLFLKLDKTIIVMQIVWPFAYTRTEHNGKYN